MAKKYLLYIHNGYFEIEQEKSKLVNRLLDEWYASGTPEKPVIIMGPDIPKIMDGVMSKPKVIKTPKDVPIISEEKLCQHGKPVTFCKFAKPGRPCK